MKVVEGLDEGWVAREYKTVDLGDERLNQRLKVIARDQGAQPSAPLNQASGDWAATKAAYRFFENERVTAAELLAPHQWETQKRMVGQALVLAVQDTCYVNYTHHPATMGLGTIGGQQVGLVMHSTMALTPGGLPLGLITQQIWARAEPEVIPEPDDRPIEEKESYKWLHALEETMVLIPEEIRVVTIADRESDIFEFMTWAEDLDADYVIRAAQDRCVQDAGGKLWAQLEAQAPQGTLTLDIPARPGQAARQAQVVVRFGSVTLLPPQSQTSPERLWLEPLTVWGVLVQELHPPAGVTPVEWLLLTNVSVTSWQEALERLRWYCARWGIEVWHKVLKSGCTVEDCRLETADRLIRYLSLMSVIAWRLFWLTHISRHEPDAPCTAILADHEWKALYCTIHQTDQLPTTLPTVRHAVRWIAQLGGFLARAGDLEPGITAIWRGWTRLADVAALWLLLHPS